MVSGQRTWGILCLLGLFSVGCISKESAAPSNSSGGGPALGTPGSPAAAGATTSGSISIHGSSTVYPISQLVAEKFKEQNPNVEIDVGTSGTSGGFKKLITQEIDICDASRPITDSEKKALADKGIEYLELQVAVDALTVAVNPANDWLPCISISQLKKIWEPSSQVKKWSDV